MKFYGYDKSNWYIRVDFWNTEIATISSSLRIAWDFNKED